MKKNTLPQILKGDWIWIETLRKRYSRTLFLRKDFILDSVVPYADFYISASGAYHLYVNGEYVGFGPASSPAGCAYCDRYDISMYLQGGMNTIGILALDLAAPSYSHLMKDPGVWCQLDIDDKPLLWSSTDWSVFDGSSFETGTARRNTGIEFTEKQILDAKPVGWNKPGFQSDHWRNATAVRPVTDMTMRLLSYPCTPCDLNQTDLLELLGHGTFKEGYEHTHVSFRSLSNIRNPYGTYAAQTFFRGEKDAAVQAALSSDDPVVVFLNDELVFSKGVDLGALHPDPWRRLFPLEFSNIHSAPLFPLRLRVKQGWNKLVVLQKTDPAGMGFSIIFPSWKSGKVKFKRETLTDAMAGWKIAGPLKMPIEEALPSIPVDRLDCMPFTPIPENISDASTWLNSCAFTLKQDPLDMNKGIGEGEFLIYKLPSLMYGFPVIDLEGHSGDIVDITCGLEIRDSKVIPIAPELGRNTDTFVLSEGFCHAMRLYPRGARYLMLSVRKARKKIRFAAVRFAIFMRDTLKENDFECSDPVFNEIWKISMESLKQSSNLSFLDNPCGKRCQSILESMIQSLASFYMLGETRLSEKALLEFASAQIETGNIPDIATSDLAKFLPDYALLWPIWLNYHWNFSGDAAFRDKMLQHLDLLIACLRRLIGKDGLLHSSAGEGVRIHSYLTDVIGIEREGVVTALNALFCRSILSSASLYEAADQSVKAAETRKLAEENANAIRKLVFDKKSCLFADCVRDGKKSETASAQTNLLALLSGTAPAECLDVILKTFVSESMIRGCEASSMFNIFILETLFSFGRGEQAFRLIRNTYIEKKQAEENYGGSGGTPAQQQENTLLKGEREDSSEHAGRIIPGIFLIRELLGIRPAVPGLSQVYFNPAIHVVSHAKGHISTPYGKIFIEWSYKAGELNVVADANYPLDIAPDFPPELLEHCTFQLGNSVSVLMPGDDSL